MQKAFDNTKLAPQGDVNASASDRMKQEAIEALVAAFHAGNIVPEDALEFMNEWAAVDGWDELLSASGQELLVPLLDIGQLQLTDEECRANLGLSSRQRITKAHRLQHARQVLSDLMPDDNCPTLAVLPIKASGGREAILGGLICIEGQGGAMPYLDGIYASREAVLAAARGKHFITWEGLEQLSDEELLAAWNGGRSVI